MKKPVVKVINKSNRDLPKYESLNAAGLDIRANIQKEMVIHPGEIKLIPTEYLWRSLVDTNAKFDHEVDLP